MRDAKGNTLLHHACMQNKKKVAKAVLRVGANINAQNLQVNPKP
jgi:ankyrin repeat protein